MKSKFLMFLTSRKVVCLVIVITSFASIYAQNKPDAIKALNFRSTEYVELSNSQELDFEKFITQLNKDKVYRIVNTELCGKYRYMSGTSDFDENKDLNDEDFDAPFPLQIVYKRVINFNIDSTENYLIKFELDNCVNGNAYYRDFAFFTSIDKNIIFNKSLTEEFKNKFHQYVISKFNEEDRLCYNSNKHNYTFTGGLDITKIKNNIVYGEYILYGANAPNCCPEYGGNFEYNMILKKMQFKNEYHDSFLQDEQKYNSDKSKSGHYKVISNKAFFYSEPQEATKKTSYLIKGNKVNIKNSKGEFGYGEYQNTQGKITKGWLKLSDIISTTITDVDPQAVAIAKMQKEEQIKVLLEQQRIAEAVKKAEQQRLIKEAEEKKIKDQFKGYSQKPSGSGSMGSANGCGANASGWTNNKLDSSYVSLLNRKCIYQQMILNTTKKFGKIIINIKVNSLGNVIEAKYQQIGSTSSDASLISISEQASIKTKFNPDTSNNTIQSGTITYLFRSAE